MKNEAIRLSTKFFAEVKKFPKDSQGKLKAPNAYKAAVLHNIEELLSGGLAAEQLSDSFDKFNEENGNAEDIYNVDDLLKALGVSAQRKEVKRDPNNLMSAGSFYYHPALQNSPPPPVVRQLDDGSFVTSYDDEEFFLEMKDSFTYDDLANYFHERMGINGEAYKQRDIGSFKYWLKSHDLDTLLYTIDAARFFAEDYGKPLPKNPFDVRDYIEEGENILEGRKNTCYMEGLDRVIPRNARKV